MTQQAYCADHGVSLGSLQRWREVFRQERADSQSQSNAVRLVPVQWEDALPVAVTPLILVLRNGQRLEIAADFDTATLKRVLAVLQAVA